MNGYAFTLQVGCALAFLLVASCATDDEADAQSNFEDALAFHLNAVQSRDLEALSSTLAEDILVILPDGETLDGKDAVIEFHRAWFLDNEWTWAPSVRQVSAESSQARALLQYAYADAPGGEQRYAWLSLAFRKTGGRWLLYLDQNTSINRADAPQDPQAH